MITKWINDRYGVQFGSLDGISHSSTKQTDDNNQFDCITRNRRSKVLIGTVETNYPYRCKIYVFFCFRFLIKGV